MGNPVVQMQEVLDLLATAPLVAADRMDAMANQLHEAANAIRERCQDGKWDEPPFRAPGGMTDVVTTAVVGPDGKVKTRTTNGG